MMISLQRLSFYNKSWRKFSLTKLIVVLFFVVLISFTSYAYGATVPVGLLPFEVAINEDTKRAYVSHADGTVHVIKTDTETTEAIIPIGIPGALTGLDVDPFTDNIYVANSQANKVFVIDGDPLSADFHTVLVGSTMTETVPEP